MDTSLIIRFEDLELDELDHEIFIRSLSNALSRKDKIDALITRFNDENTSMEDPPIFDTALLDKEREFKVCMEKLKSMNNALQAAFTANDFGTFSVLTSRVIHVSGRLNRLLLTFKDDKRFSEAVKSVELTLDNIAKVPIGAAKPVTPVVIPHKDIQNFNIQGSMRPILKPSTLSKKIDDAVPALRKDAGRDEFNTNIGRNNQSSPNHLEETNAKYDSLSAKVDRLTESFAEFIRFSGAAGAAGGTGAIPKVPRVPLNVNPFNVDLGNNRNFRIPGMNQGNQRFEDDEVIEDMRNRMANPNVHIRGPNRMVYVPNRNKKPIPINQWKVRFSGEENTLSLSEFLGEVDLYAESELFSNQELFASAVHLFTGYARKWYKANYWEFTSWEDLVSGLKEEFQPEYYDFLLMSEIDARLQGKDESFSSFFAEMLILFGKLGRAISEKHKIFYLKKNMLKTYALAIAAIDIVSVRQLAVICKRLDSTKQLQEQHQNLSSGRFVEPAFKTPNPFQPRKPFRQPINTVDFQEEEEQDDEGQDVENICAFRRGAPRTELNLPRNQFANNPRNVVCFNCELPGHVFRTCQAERKIFCFICGYKNVTVYTCPNCNKLNERAAP